MAKCIMFYTFLLIFDYVFAEIFTSTALVEELFNQEVSLTESLRSTLIANPMLSTPRLRRLLADTEEAFSLSLLSLDLSHFVHHPITMYHVIRRMAFEWKGAAKYISNPKKLIQIKGFRERLDFLTLYKNLTRNCEMPTDNDVRGAIEAILRLWRTYKLDINELIDGKLYGIRAQKLKSHDIKRVLDIAAKKEYVFEEITLTRKLLELSPDIKTLEHHLIGSLELLEKYRKHGYMDLAFYIIKPFLQSGNKLVAQAYKWYYEHTIQQIEKTCSPVDEESYPEYESLCRGDVKSPAEQAYLKCYSKKTHCPVYLAKEEVVNIDPRISIFHDVLYEEEMTEMRKISKAKMKRSTVVPNDLNFNNPYSEARLSHSFYPEDTDFPILMKLCKRISLITGLATTEDDAETFQMANYGIGGMYEPHFDYLYEEGYKDGSEYMGERIATWMFYLSDVLAGGATVFPEIDTRIPVQKGAAAFWYNVRRNGDVDPLTIHGGCPVIIGSKFISNKWIRSDGQMFRKPCGTTVDAVFE